MRRSRLFLDQTGQDLVEYALILGFVVLVGAAVYTGTSQPIKGLWGVMNTRLVSTSN